MQYGLIYFLFFRLYHTTSATIPARDTQRMLAHMPMWLSSPVFGEVPVAGIFAVST